jgi:ABC-type polysaccharide/polyol phosphate transport system ATPase subunit
LRPQHHHRRFVRREPEVNENIAVGLSDSFHHVLLLSCESHYLPVLDARSISKRFLLRHNASVELKVRFLGLLHPEKRQKVEEFWALRDVSLTVARGETLGLVGRNGSGKSTLLKLIAGIHRPTSGQMLVARSARICSMIELGVGFHPELTGRENLFLSASIHGLTRDEIEAVYGAIVEYSGLEHFIDVPIKNYSSGMYMRLGFAIAANLRPDILLLDEIFAVGDAEFQERCTATMHRFVEEGGTIVFVSHAASAISAICRRVCVLDHGHLVFDGEVQEGLAFYQSLSSERPIVPPLCPKSMELRSPNPWRCRLMICRRKAISIPDRGQAARARFLKLPLRASLARALWISRARH